MVATSHLVFVAIFSFFLRVESSPRVPRRGDVLRHPKRLNHLPLPLQHQLKRRQYALTGSGIGVSVLGFSTVASTEATGTLPTGVAAALTTAAPTETRGGGGIGASFVLTTIVQASEVSKVIGQAAAAGPAETSTVSSQAAAVTSSGGPGNFGGIGIEFVSTGFVETSAILTANPTVVGAAAAGSTSSSVVSASSIPTSSAATSKATQKVKTASADVSSDDSLTASTKKNGNHHGGDVTVTRTVEKTVTVTAAPTK
ncbi:hypothetical protein T439DRAFT_344725 [Meredithblackwellia eburnea MCA 4105]